MGWPGTCFSRDGPTILEKFPKSTDTSWLPSWVSLSKKYRELTFVGRGYDRVSPHERVLPNFRFFLKVQKYLVAALLGSPLEKVQ